MEEYYCKGCEQKTTRLKSRCLMQLSDTSRGKWNHHCIRCCCLNKRRQKPCDDPRGLGWVKE